MEKNTVLNLYNSTEIIEFFPLSVAWQSEVALVSMTIPLLKIAFGKITSVIGLKLLKF